MSNDQPIFVNYLIDLYNLYVECRAGFWMNNSNGLFDSRFGASREAADIVPTGDQA